MRANYHSHIYRCNHAEGTVDDVVLEAIKLGYNEIGISDHVPFSDIASKTRMNFEELEEYIEEIEEAKVKYKDKIKVYKGFECEYYDKYHQYYIDLKNKYGCDYLILGQHYTDIDGKRVNFWKTKTKQDVRVYRDTVVKALDTGYFDYLAHPDFIGKSYDEVWDQDLTNITKDIVDACVRNNVVIEYNANGMRSKMKKKRKTRRNEHPYPWPDFWKVVATYGDKIKVVIGADNHMVRHLGDNTVKRAYKDAKQLGLNVIDFIEI